MLIVNEVKHTFDFHPRTRLIFEPGGLEKLGKLVRDLGGSRTLLVTDPHIVSAGHSGRAQRSIREAGGTSVVFDQVRENPTTRDVSLCVEVARAERIDFIVGLGGGSSMDTAKGCNFLLTNGGAMEDYWGYGKAPKAMLPFIAVPTTAGTGSECQSYALIAQRGTHRKMACGDPKAAAAVALLDPELTLTMPRMVTINTGLDALTHAVECAVTTKANPVSLLFAREAFRLCHENLTRVLADPLHLEARGNMLLAAALAGMAIENSMLGAAHSAANPLTSRFDMIHGQAVGFMLPWVVAYNGSDEAARAAYKELAVYGRLARQADSPAAALAALKGRLEEILEIAGIPADLGQFGVSPEDVPLLAQEAAEQWTAQFNPRPIGQQDFEHLYHDALRGRGF